MIMALQRAMCCILISEGLAFSVSSCNHDEEYKEYSSPLFLHTAFQHHDKCSSSQRLARGIEVHLFQTVW